MKTRKYKQVKKDLSRAIVDSHAVRHNIAFLRAQSKTDLMAVLKADAFGHGIVGMSKMMRTFGIKFIGVATLGEAILLRKNGDTGRILAWLYNIHSAELHDALKMDLDIAIFDETHIPKIAKMAGNTRVKITIFVDTGINRAGIKYENALRACQDVVSYQQFELVGVMSHLICSEQPNSPVIIEQLSKFRLLRKALEEVNIVPPLFHIANTDACLNYDVSDFSLSRVGKGLYGLHDRLKLALTLETNIIQIKTVEKGEGIGYDALFIAPKQTLIAILPIGYADCLQSNSVYINKTKRKILGMVSMDQMVVQAHIDDKVNDVAIIFGNGVNCPQTIVELSRIIGTLPQVLLCNMGNRIARVYR